MPSWLIRPIFVALLAAAAFLGYMHNLKLAAGYVLLFFVTGLALSILSDIITGDIDLSQLISDKDGFASMGRFQLLVFTFVVALSLFLIVAATSEFPRIPGEILTLLGISATTFAVSKGVDASAPDDPAPTSKKENISSADPH
jgi:uncharacterized membrane protein